jgi:acetyl esterase/lipase/NAD(P)-dependent dehydrogenase (short-subunit alcohol dehydrogenase family)
VLVNDIDGVPANEVADEITDAGGRSVPVQADITDWSEAGMLIDRCVDEFGKIDGLVNNAGRFMPGDLVDIDEEHVRGLFEANVIGAVACGTHALRRMVVQGQGSVVNVVSGAHFGLAHMAIYGATKGAIASLTYSWALEVEDSGVRVNAVSPLAKTRMTQLAARWYEERGAGQIDYENSPDPAVNAPLAIYLLSDGSKAVNGQIVRIEGRQLALVAHPAVLDPVLSGDWTIKGIDQAFREQLQAHLVPVGVGPLVRAQYLEGASAFWASDAAVQTKESPEQASAGEQPKPASALAGIDWTSAQLSDIAAIRSALNRSPAIEAEIGKESEEITVRKGQARPIRFKVTRPEGPGPFPCLYWMHGGGYFSGSALVDDPRLARWSAEASMVVVSVDYRLAPEHPFPAEFEDCLAGLNWVFENAADLNVDPARIGIGGGSAGGGLAAAVALGARDGGYPGLAFQLLLYPMLDDRGTTSFSQMDAPFWPPAANSLGWKAYLGSEAGALGVSAYAAPARATDLESLPPAYVCVGTRDISVDESIEYAKRLITAGVPVDLNVISGAPHGFHLLEPQSEAAQRSIGDICRYLVQMTRP